MGPTTTKAVGPRTVARYLARERRKAELRAARDVLVLTLAADIGERALAGRLDVTRETVGKLLADARDRLHAESPLTDPMIAVPHRDSDPDSRAELDTYYEALGARPHSRGAAGPRRRADDA
jgi:hypothetical protein